MESEGCAAGEAGHSLVCDEGADEEEGEHAADEEREALAEVHGGREQEAELSWACLTTSGMRSSSAKPVSG